MNNNAKDLSKWRIDDFGCTVRLYHKLYRGGITTVGDLVEKTEEDIRSIYNIGRSDIAELKRLLELNDLTLKK